MRPTDTPRFVTFGELLLRFSKEHHQRLAQGATFTSMYGGSEANVAVSLATLGDRVDYVTRLPDSPVGRGGVMRLQQMGVGCSHVLYGGNRIGTYYFEPAAGMRAAKVIYDRDHSAYSELVPGMIDWHTVLRGATVLHVSGITAAISQGAADATFEALDVADELGVAVSFDINYRKNLWRYDGADAKAVLSRMLGYADLVFADVIEYEYITGHPAIPFEARSSSYDMDLAAYEAWFDEIHARFPRCRRWLMGIRNQISSSHHALTALLWNEGRMYSTRIYDIPGIVDPMGVGDAFAAAFNHACMAEPGNPQFCLDYSLAAAALKNSIVGDFNLATDDEIRALMRS